jgi:hypothetical protein
MDQSSMPALTAQLDPNGRARNYMAGNGVNEPVLRQANLAVLTRLQHEMAIARLPHLYAQAIDRADFKALDRIFTHDALMVAPLGTQPMRDRAGILNIPNVLSRSYRATFHAVLNHTVLLGDRVAVGEVYCLARHFYPEREGRHFSNDMSLLYQDQYRLNDDNVWRFSLRRVVMVAHEPLVEIAAPAVG